MKAITVFCLCATAVSLFISFIMGDVQWSESGVIIMIAIIGWKVLKELYSLKHLISQKDEKENHID